MDADLAGTGMMGRVVGVFSDTRQIAFPTHSAVVDVDAAQHVCAFNEQPPASNLRRRPMTVSRKHAIIRWSAEPQKSKWCFNSRVGTDNAIGRISVLMRPNTGAFQRAHAFDQSPARHLSHLGRRQRFSAEFCNCLVTIGNAPRTALGP